VHNQSSAQKKKTI